MKLWEDMGSDKYGVPYTNSLDLGTRDRILLVRDKEVSTSRGNGNIRVSQIYILEFCNIL